MHPAGAAGGGGAPAAGGGRIVQVPPERLAAWADGFAHRHGPFTSTRGDGEVALEAEDGATAVLTVPFPPVTEDGPALTTLIAHARLDRPAAVLLVRLGGYAVGIFDGSQLVRSKVDSRLVHGRQRNGGSSQKRYARRRENEVKDLIAHAADLAARILLPAVPGVDAVFTGGDKRAIDQVLADRRLAPLAAKRTGPFLTVPDPKRAILEETPAMFRAVRIHVTDPPG
ncbi:MAG: hypothetical protein JWO79_930 [Actinomycetia bacterium]|nr:hypothetical protein [Actinomycetes bacterium]